MVWYAPMMSKAEEHKNANPDTATNQDRSQASQIDSLAQDKDLLNSKVDTWNHLYIGALLLALGVAGFTAYAQLKTIRLSKHVVSLQEQIDSEKDRESRQQIAKLYGTTETLRKENLSLQAEVLRLRAQAADRHLSAIQRSDLVKALLPFAGQSANILPRMDKPEAVGFSRELLDALTEDAHWLVAETGGLMGRENPEDRGIVVDVSSQHTPERAQKLVDALSVHGFKARLNKRIDDFPIDGVLIIVGSKP
jgi:cell division protein FtsL